MFKTLTIRIDLKKNRFETSGVTSRSFLFGRNKCTENESHNQFTGHSLSRLAKRFGKRDGETGYQYHGARYYNEELGRYMSTDRFAVKFFHQSPYVYAGNRPIDAIDVNGDSIKLVGSWYEQYYIFTQLQSLTNDQLGMRDNGDIYVKKRGKANTDKELSTGTELIRDAIKNKHTAFISTTDNEHDDKNTGIQGQSVENETNGVGVDTHIVIDKTSDSENHKVLVQDSKTGKSIYENFKNNIILGHELIHGYYDMIGKAVVYEEKASYTFIGTDGKKYIVSGQRKEETETVGLTGNRKYTENKLRLEQGLNKRIKY